MSQDTTNNVILLSFFAFIILCITVVSISRHWAAVRIAKHEKTPRKGGDNVPTTQDSAST